MFFSARPIPVQAQLKHRRSIRKEHAVKPSNETQSDRQRLSAIILELRTNRDTVARMTTGYTMFRFTGGGVASEQLQCSEISSCLKSPFGIEAISAQDVERYEVLIDEVTAMAETVKSGAEPRTWRRRNDLACAFDHATAELVALGNRLESGLERSTESDA
jgi:hypothetical protein